MYVEYFVGQCISMTSVLNLRHFFFIRTLLTRHISCAVTNDNRTKHQTVHSMGKRRLLRVNDFGSVAYYLQQELWSAAYKRQSTCGSSTYQSGPGCMKTRLMGRGTSQWTMCRAPPLKSNMWCTCWSRGTQCERGASTWVNYRMTNSTVMNDLADL